MSRYFVIINPAIGPKRHRLRLASFSDLEGFGLLTAAEMPNDFDGVIAEFKGRDSAVAAATAMCDREGSNRHASATMVQLPRYLLDQIDAVAPVFAD